MTAGLLAAVACGSERDAAPRWIELTRGFEPAPVEEIARGWCDGAVPGLRPRPRSDEDPPGVAWLELPIPDDDWTAGEVDGTYWIERPRSGPLRNLPAAVLRVTAEDHRYARSKPADPPAPGEFAVTAQRVLVAPPAARARPAGIVLAWSLQSGELDGDTWRVREASRTAAGIPVWSGHAESVDTTIPPDSLLSVVTAWAGAEGARPPRLRILLDGRVLFDEPADRADRWRRIALPAEGRSGAELTFETRDGDGLGIFLQPVIRPVDVGTYDTRPWGSARPNLVLLLADTFRADNMATYGGTGDLTPRLDALARRSMRFLDARSTATWTLPAVSSLFTGLYPGQHGATANELTLGDELTTLAELFSEAGYRTGGITDASFVSMAYGLDQGFEWFEQHSFEDWDLEATVGKARAFLERDDGRPAFLVVHSYRVHSPYRPGASGDTSDWRRLQQEGVDEFTRRVAAGARRRGVARGDPAVPGRCAAPAVPGRGSSPGPRSRLAGRRLRGGRVLRERLRAVHQRPRRGLRRARRHAPPTRTVGREAEGPAPAPRRGDHAPVTSRWAPRWSTWRRPWPCWPVSSRCPSGRGAT